jgi:phosphatidate cytidylyltransferase
MNLEHKKRWVAAVAGIFVFAAIYYFFRHWGLVIATILVSWGAYSEFLVFSGASRTLRLTSSFVGLALSVWLCLDLPGALAAFYLASLAIVLRCLWQAHASPVDTLGMNFQHAQSRLFGLAYLVLFPSFLPKVHALPHGMPLTLLLFLVVWLGDTAGYYGGKTWGKRKLSANVSPGKTLEGALTALVVCVLLGITFSFFSLGHLAMWKLPLLTFTTSLVAQAGDLVESLMKRAYQVKDSGGLIPGHGGVFDRFDSIILAAPFFYLAVLFLS